MGRFQMFLDNYVFKAYKSICVSFCKVLSLCVLQCMFYGGMRAQINGQQ